jgi:hypothetical protein
LTRISPFHKITTPVDYEVRNPVNQGSPFSRGYIATIGKTDPPNEGTATEMVHFSRFFDRFGHGRCIEAGC